MRIISIKEKLGETITITTVQQLSDTFYLEDGEILEKIIITKSEHKELFNMYGKIPGLSVKIYAFADEDGLIGLDEIYGCKIYLMPEYNELDLEFMKEECEENNDLLGLQVHKIDEDYYLKVSDIKDRYNITIKSGELEDRSALNVKVIN